MFEPPVGGVYLLTVYATCTDYQTGKMYIKNNDDILCEAWLQSEVFANTATCSAIAELAVGDSVRVTGDTSDPAEIRPSNSGFLGHIIVE